MADFRKLLLALIAGALMFGTVAGAADFSCQMSANPTLVRSEAVADFVGDVLLNCSGSMPQLNAGDAVIANIRLTVSQGAIITSQVLETSRKVSEATLVLDNAGWYDFGNIFSLGTWQYHPKGYYALNSGATMPTPFADGSQNVYQAVQISDTELEWQGVVLIGPGSMQAAPGRVMNKTILLSNVRVNAQGLGVGSPIYGQVNIQTPTAIPVYGNQQLLLANIRQGLTVSHSGASIKNCDLIPNGSIAFTTTFTEGTGGGSFGTAFKPVLNGRTGAVNHYAPGTGYFDESGYNPLGFSSGGGVLPGLDVSSVLVNTGNIGLATQGTQFRIRLTNIPSGLTISASDVVPTATNGMQISSATVSGSGTATVDITLEVTGFASVGGSYPAETFQDVVTVVTTARYTAPPVVGVATAHGRFWPDYASYTTAQTRSVAAIPRFVDSSIVPDAAVITISQSCKTMLLFPYLTSSAGYNSGIAISNTSVDPYGAAVVSGQIQFPTTAYGVTKPQAGACTLYFYGQSSGAALTAAQQAQTIIEVPAGGQFVTNLAVGAKGFVYSLAGAKTAACDTDGTPVGNTCPDLPAFVGYMIANCNFQFAHGFSFVTDTGSDRTMGYLALVIPDRGTGGNVASPATRLPQEASLANNTLFNYNQGEQLAP
jgi:hypothetical protein